MSIGHWINGETYSPSDRRTAPIFDPAHGEKVNDVVLANPDDVDRAVAAAHEAFGSWSQVSSARKQTILFNFREVVNARKDELVQLITQEHGKVISDAAGEIARGQEVLEFALSFPELLKGDYSSQVSTDVDVYSTREPLGPVAIICPFNFPAMVPMWFFPIAIAAGNTVVIKPSEKVPSALNWEAELWKEAGLPDGVFNVVHGGKPAVDALLEHDDIKAVSFVCSTPIAKYVYETATARD